VESKSQDPWNDFVPRRPSLLESKDLSPFVNSKKYSDSSYRPNKINSGDLKLGARPFNIKKKNNCCYLGHGEPAFLGAGVTMEEDDLVFGGFSVHSGFHVGEVPAVLEADSRGGDRRPTRRA
jgi:hypothetical protein